MLEVRVARAEDLPRVLEIERNCATAPHWAATEYGRIVSGNSVVLRESFVVEADATVVGFAVGVVRGDTGELESVAVVEGARRGGVGRALCVAVMDWCREQGARCVELEVRAGSAGAIALYGALGFHEVGRRVAYYGDPVEDAVLMRAG